MWRATRRQRSKPPAATERPPRDTPRPSVIERKEFQRADTGHGTNFMAPRPPSARVAPVLHHQAVVLHHLDPGGRQLPGRLVVHDPGLEPDVLGLLGDDVLDVLRDVGGAPEDV